jgi:hypothetical protein
MMIDCDRRFEGRDGGMISFHRCLRGAFLRAAEGTDCRPDQPAGETIDPMRVRTTILGLLLLTGMLAGCAAPNGGGSSARPDYNYNIGSCYSSGLGPGYSRDFSYGDRYVSGQNRQC